MAVGLIYSLTLGSLEPEKGGSSSVVERQLPKLNVAGSIPVSRSNQINNLENPTKTCAPSVLRSHDEQLLFKLIDCGQSARHWRLPVNVLADIEGMAALIGH